MIHPAIIQKWRTLWRAIRITKEITNFDDDYRLLKKHINRLIKQEPKQ